MDQDPDRLLALAHEGEELCSIGYICVFEVLNPAAPTLVTKSNVIGNVAGSQSSSSVFGLEGQILYVPSYDKLYVVDFQNPTAPTTLATLTVPGSSGTVLIDVAASRVYLAKPCLTGQACFYVVDVSTPASFPGPLVSCCTQLFVTDSEGPLVMSFCGLFPQNTPLESVTLHVSEYYVNASAAPAGDWLSENEPLMILAIGQS
ncbi:hypothetical protein WME98_29195 [Sorangium sp. So ce296]|uniref:hypothetical protein n=1 Tax=Sorangium sp. So ce296 TaxID=3133296 RepID=UPI003F608444